MRYVVKLKIVCLPEEFRRVRATLGKFGFEVEWSRLVELTFEKGSPLLPKLEQSLAQIGHSPAIHYKAAFDKGEVEQAELLQLRFTLLCGDGFASVARSLGLPVGTRVMDKHAMRKHDIGLTYAFDLVISERLRTILLKEGLSGWTAYPIRHSARRSDRYPPLFELVATNELPPLEADTEIETVEHMRPLVWPPDHPMYGTPDPLLGTTAIFQRGPLRYRKAALSRLEDFNRTKELFGEAPQRHPIIVVSQRTRRVFSSHKVRGIEPEPVLLD